jgi:hypothetical protein
MRFNHLSKSLLWAVLCFVSVGMCQSPRESSALTLARVRYDGGGDWYNDPSAIPNLCEFIQKETSIDINNDEAKMSILDESLFIYPILFLTGHGKITLSDEEAERLRNYLLQGGFLYADDDYGLDSYFRKMMQQVFPDRPLVELPFSHDIYHVHFQFDHGLPKIHEHDNKPPQGFGIVDDQNRLMVFYTYETNISDGWADPQVHEDPPEKREAALRMGLNIIVYALMH